MPRIYSTSILDSMVCTAKLLDALKPRHGKAGPARQGQTGHRLAESYLGHLHRTKQDTDLEAGARMWSALKSQLTAEDEAAVSDSIEAFVLNNAYPWVVSAQEFSTETPRFFTVPDRREVPADRVHLLDCPIFRITTDMTWHGEGPISVPGIDGPSHWLLDWKWHRQIEHVTNPERNRQLLRYSSAAFGPELGVTVACLGFPRKNYYEACSFSEDQRMQAWVELVCEPIARAERLLDRVPEDPDKTVGVHCRNCDLLRGCDAAQRYPFEAPWLESAGRTEKVVALAIAKLIVKDLHAAVKHDVNTDGPIIDDDLETSIEEAEFLTFDRDTVERVAGSLVSKADLESMFKATKTSVLDGLKRAKVKKDERLDIIDQMRVTADRKLQSRLKMSKVAATRSKVAATREQGDGGDGEGSG